MYKLSLRQHYQVRIQRNILIIIWSSFIPVQCVPLWLLLCFVLLQVTIRRLQISHILDWTVVTNFACLHRRYYSDSVTDLTELICQTL